MTFDAERRLELFLALVDQFHTLLVAAAEHVPHDDADVLRRPLVLEKRVVFGVLVDEVVQEIADESVGEKGETTTCREWSAPRPDCREDGSSETLGWSSSSGC